MGNHYPIGGRQLNNEAFHTGSTLGSAQKFLSWAWHESPVWKKFGSDFEFRLGIFYPSCTMITLVLIARAPSWPSVKCPMWLNYFKNNIWKCSILKSRHKFIVASDHWQKKSFLYYRKCKHQKFIMVQIGPINGYLSADSIQTVGCRQLKSFLILLCSMRREEWAITQLCTPKILFSYIMVAASACQLCWQYAGISNESELWVLLRQMWNNICIYTYQIK